MSLRTLSASALVGVLPPLKAAGFILGGIVVAILITGCSPAEPKKSEPEKLAPSAAETSSAMQKAVLDTTPPEPTPTETVPASKAWKTYTSNTLHFSVLYPSDWITSEYVDSSALEMTEIAFGTKESQQGGLMWAVTVYKKTSANINLESLIKNQGKQFADRIETRQAIQVNGHNALFVRVASKKDAWISKIVYIETSDSIYAISDGAVEDPQFVKFYSSFTLNI